MHPNWKVLRSVSSMGFKHNETQKNNPLTNHVLEIKQSFEDSGPISNFDAFFSQSDEIGYPGFDVSETEYCKSSRRSKGTFSSLMSLIVCLI